MKKLLAVLIGAGLLGGLAMSASALEAASISTNIRNGSNATVTSALIGTSVHDTVTVASSTGPTPTGTVDFTLFSTANCSGTGVTQSAVALVSGNAQSSTTTVGVNGLSYKVHYNGDATYAAGDSLCAVIQPLKLTPIVATDILNQASAVVTSVVPNTTVHDKAMVTGSSTTPTGSVDFTFYTNASCSAGASSAGGGVSLTSGSALSANEGPLSSGSYSFKAHYNGDATYVSVDGQCEPLTVGQQSSVISTILSASTVVAGTSVYDSVTLSGVTSNAGGSVNYSVFSNNACSTGLQSGGQKTVTNGSVPNSNSIQFNTPGSFYWQAVYSGDANNTAATSTCLNGLLTVNATSTATTTGTISGKVYNDANKNSVIDNGENGLSGWTIKLTGSKKMWLRYDNHKQPLAKYGYRWQDVSLTATTDANGNYTFANLAPGTYLIKEVVQKNWKQTTKDPKQIVVVTGSQTTSVNFGNVSKETPKPPCLTLNSKGSTSTDKWNLHLKHCDGDDDATTTPPMPNDTAIKALIQHQIDQLQQMINMLKLKFNF